MSTTPTLHFRIVSVVRERIYEDATRVTAPTKAGVITILPHHEAIISALQPGVLTVEYASGSSERFAVGGGVVETDGTTLTVIADMVEDATEMSSEEVVSRHAALEREIASYRAAHDAIDMDRLIALEEEYLRESARMHLLHG